MIVLDKNSAENCEKYAINKLILIFNAFLLDITYSHSDKD